MEKFIDGRINTDIIDVDYPDLKNYMEDGTELGITQIHNAFVMFSG